MKRIFSCLICVLLASVFVFNAISVGALELIATNVESDLNAKLSELIKTETAPPYAISELESLRDAFTKHYLMSDGSRLAVKYDSAIHYETDNGFEEFDGTAEQLAGSSVFTASAGDIILSTDEGLSNALVTVITEEYSVGFSAAGAHSTANKSIINYSANYNDLTTKLQAEELLEKKITPAYSEVKYTNMYPNTDLIYRVIGGTIKEDIVVKSAQSNYSYAFLLNLNGMYPESRNDGSIALKDNASDVTKLVIPAAFMYDANGEYSSAIQYGIELDNGKYTLTVTADSSWINDKERKFPVVIDPTIEAPSGAQDTYIASNEPSTAQYGQNLRVGYDSSKGTMYTLWRDTTLPVLPTGATVTKAELLLYQIDYSNYGYSEIPVVAKEINRGWSSSSIKWNDFDSDDIGTIKLAHETLNSDTFGVVGFNITNKVKGWYAGEANYGIALCPDVSGEDDLEENKNGYATFISSYYSDAEVRPTLSVQYRSVIGINDTYTYHSSKAENATVYTNDYTGGLVAVLPTELDSGEDFPISADLIFNSALSDYEYTAYTQTSAFNKALYGYGWKPSVLEMVNVVYTDPTTNDVEVYVYRDEYGSEYYLHRSDDIIETDEQTQVSTAIPIYEDENGIGFVLEVRSNALVLFKDDYEKHFDLSNGHITKLIYNDNEFIYNYIDGKLSSITKDASKSIYSFFYDEANYLISILGNGGFISLLYENGQLSRLTLSNLDAYYVEYTGSQICKLYNKDIIDVLVDPSKVFDEGLKFTYNQNRITTVYKAFSNEVYSECQYETHEVSGGNVRFYGYGTEYCHEYSFDNYGRTVGIYTETIGDDACFDAAGISYMEGSSASRIKSVAESNMGVRNYLRNFSFETGSGWSTLGATTATAGVYIQPSATETQNVLMGNRSYRILADGSNAAIRGVYQTVTLPAGTYTVSGYIKTQNLIGVNGGANIAVYNVADGFSAPICHSEYLVGTSNIAVQNGFRRLAVTFTISEQKMICVLFGVKSGVSGTAYFDCVQLESGESYNQYNMLANSGFEEANSANIWEITNDEFATSVAEKHFDNKSLMLDGDYAKRVSASQTVSIDNVGAKHYVISGWAKANSTAFDAAAIEDVVDGTAKTFGIVAEITYGNRATQYEYAAFNPYNTDWQYTSLGITIEDVDDAISIKVKCVYDYNSNTAYFDNISLTADMVYDLSELYEEGTAEDHPEEVPEESAEEYPTSETIENFKYSYAYDDNRNITSVIKEYIGSESGYNSTDKFYTHFTYDDENRINSFTDERGKTTSYTYDANGNYASITDPKGYTTLYAYTSDDLLQKVQMAIGSGSSAKNISNNYTYNDDGFVTGITHKVNDTTTQSYSFIYDIYGSLTSVSCGTTVLATYTYDVYNRSLITRVTYANGTYVDYIYDDFDNLIEIKIKGASKYKWKYDRRATLLEHIDVSAGTTEKYEYDFYGNLVRVYTIKTSTKTFVDCVEYAYDSSGVLQSTTYAHPEGNKTYSYTYDDDGALTKVTIPTGVYEDTTEDVFGRTIGKHLKYDSEGGAQTVIGETYSYLAGSGENASTYLIGAVTYNDNNVYSYTYDDNGNILTISINGNTKYRYYYNELNQLSNEAIYPDVGSGNYAEEYEYFYDCSGNVVKKIRYYGPDIIYSESTVYTYGNTAWGDQLTKIGDTTITYDASGNPRKWYNASDIEWMNGRQISLFAKPTGEVISYSYNADGIRTGKQTYDANGSIVDDVKYVVYNGNIVKETHYTGDVMYYYYGENDDVIGLTYNDEDFYYRKNLQGDIISIHSEDGTKVVEYSYNAWGKVLSVSGTLSSTLGEANPFRYRSYYYDTDTSFYYLQSRYYDPEVGRWLNAKIQAAEINGEIIGYDPFTYCVNNPVNYIVNGVSEEKLFPARELYIPWIEVFHDVPLYNQNGYSLCWAFCQVMVDDYMAGVSRTNAEATDSAIYLAMKLHSVTDIDDVEAWNKGGKPLNLGKAIIINSIYDLFIAVYKYGPLYASYGQYVNGARQSGHGIIVTGVNVTTGIVYTNNPWGKRGEQTYEEFLKHFVGTTDSRWRLDLCYQLEY